MDPITTSAPEPQVQQPNVAPQPYGHNHNHLSQVSAKVCEDLRNSNTIEGLDEDECIISIIHKHPIGLFMLYFGAIFGLGVGFGLMYYLTGQLFDGAQQSNATTFLNIAFVIVAMLVGIGIVIATYVYRQSRLLITNKNVTQIIQRSLFSRKVSELSMSNVEDVTAEKDGIIAAIFDYGRLNIQTAGEIENFVFTYCPKPNNYGRVILDAHQEYVDALRDNNNV